VLELRRLAGSSALVTGWQPASQGDAVVPPEGRWAEVSGAQVYTLHHYFDGIPEGFFLVRSGGVTIFFSGDHGSTSEPPNTTFQANIDRMAAATDSVDMAFISSFGTRDGRSTLNPGDVYTIQNLEPRVTLPMHCGSCEERYAAFAGEVAKLGLETTVGVADSPGWFLHYREPPSQLPTKPTARGHGASSSGSSPSISQGQPRPGNCSTQPGQAQTA
jgi:hypothetical protein